MKYKASYTGDFAVAPGGPVILRKKGQPIDITDPVHAQWLLDRNVIYSGGKVRTTKDVTNVNTKDVNTSEDLVPGETKHLAVEIKPLHKMNKTELVNYGKTVGVELDMDDMTKKDMLSALDKAALDEAALDKAK